MLGLTGERRPAIILISSNVTIAIPNRIARRKRPIASGSTTSVDHTGSREAAASSAIAHGGRCEVCCGYGCCRRRCGQWAIHIDRSCVCCSAICSVHLGGGMMLAELWITTYSVLTYHTSSSEIVTGAAIIRCTHAHGFRRCDRDSGCSVSSEAACDEVSHYEHQDARFFGSHDPRSTPLATADRINYTTCSRGILICTTKEGCLGVHIE